MTTYPLPTLAAQVTSTGISAPVYADILESLKASYRAIFGSDTYLEPDSQDGQLLAIFASAINDCNQATIAAYNSFSPTTAQGAGLSSVVKINGLARLVPSNSTALVTIVGAAGTLIANGVIGDNQSLGTTWNLPSLVTIPLSGETTVTATCTDDGAVIAAANTLTQILAPTRGWQSVNNPDAAALGDPVESDATLRQRQAVSTSLPAESVLAGIIAAVANLAGVGRYAAYENDTGVPDDNGLPGHSIAIVVEGGDATEIATAIAIKKTPGTQAYGTTEIVVIDPVGVPNTIGFFELTNVALDIEVQITALTGYVSTTEDLIIAAMLEQVNALGIGEDSYTNRLQVAAQLNGNVLNKTYNVTAILQARDGGGLSAADIVIAFDEAATLDIADVIITVT